MTRRGLALLIVVGVLGLLALLATAFVTMAQLERRASLQRLHATKAALLARSGIEDALARLAQGQDPQLAANRYGGENWDGLPANTLDAFEAAQEVYHPTGAGSRADVDACPVRHAMRPSFFARLSPGSPDPATTGVDGRRRGFSGQLTRDLATGGNTYALKVKSGGLYVNGGDPSVPVTATTDYNLNLRRILGVLAEAVDREDGLDDGKPVDQTDGFNLIDLRPRVPEGWTGWEQVRDLALGGSLAKLDALRPYLSLQTQVDRKVIRPNAVPGMEGRAGYPSWADFKLAHETYPDLPGTREPDFERIPVAPAGKIVGRAPVDLAWARTRRPVLIALLAGLKGFYLDESTGRPFAYGDLIGKVRPAEISLYFDGPSDECRLTADHILGSTSDLGTWDAWDAFCDAIPDTLFTGTTGLRQAKRDLLKANFNPNSRLNKFAPNASLWRSVDKSDLLVYSTEFSLLPQAGVQELECVGRILGKNGRLLASRTLRATLAPASLLTLTTQKEFVCGDLGDLSIAGDEATLRKPGQTPFISRSAGTGKTWGHALGQPGLDDMGASLQTYPEPCVEAGPPGTGLSIRPADYDGSVQLATIETPEDEFYLVPAPPAIPTRDMKLLARYTKDFDLDVSDAAPTKPSAPPNAAKKWRNQPDIAQVTFVSGLPGDPFQLAYGLLHPTRPNTLYPDGAYSEKDRAPSYLDRDNANGLHGLISFWIKSNKHLPPPAAFASRGQPFFRWTNFSVGVPSYDSLDQFFLLVDTRYLDTVAVWCMFEITHNASDTHMEHHFQRNRKLTPHLWSLLTMYYDFLSPNPPDGGGGDDCGELRVNAGLADEDKGSSNTYFSGHDNTPASAKDITKSDIFGAHRLTLGKGQPEFEHYVKLYAGSGADATFDELAIYDFGGATYVSGISTQAPDATLSSPEVLAADRFKQGRYYREAAYTRLGDADNTAAEYFSPPIRLGPCRIRALAWTQVVPAGLKADGDPGPDGTLLLELTDDAGGAYLDDTSGKPVDRTFDRPASSPVERTVNAPFRLHAVFQPNLADKENTPILDPMALDDVTVVYEPPGGRRILRWTGEE